MVEGLLLYSARPLRVVRQIVYPQNQQSKKNGARRKRAMQVRATTMSTTLYTALCTHRNVDRAAMMAHQSYSTHLTIYQKQATNPFRWHTMVYKLNNHWKDFIHDPCELPTANDLATADLDMVYRFCTHQHPFTGYFCTHCTMRKICQVDLLGAMVEQKGSIKGYGQSAIQYPHPPPNYILMPHKQQLVSQIL